MSTALIVLPYFERPNLVRNALESVRDQSDPRWHLAFIDDGSTRPGEPVVREILGDDPRVTCYRYEDTIDQKRAQNGSMHGKYMTDAILAGPGELVIVLCDDDALFPGCVENVHRWFDEHPEAQYGYGHVQVYHPPHERPGQVERGHADLNRHTGAIQPACQVDGSQVCFRASAFRGGGVHYPRPCTGALDASSFEQCYRLYGPCSFMGFVTQYKGVWPGQMGRQQDLLAGVDA